jgi:riboflavin biosynthesis pyrimidine reductase
MDQLLPHPGRSYEPADLMAAYEYPTSAEPVVRANMVASVDGASHLDGRSGPLSTRADQRLLGILRQLADVILVGAGTARAEHYGTVPVRAAYEDRRRAAGQLAAPPIAVISRRLDLDPDGPLFGDAVARTIVLTCADAPADRRDRLAAHADVLDVGTDRVDVGRAVDALAELGHRRIVCEGGPTVLAQLAGAGRLNELCVTTSPLLAGGAAARLLNGPALVPPTALRLVHLLEEDGVLFARYSVAPTEVG